MLLGGAATMSSFAFVLQAGGESADRLRAWGRGQNQLGAAELLQLLRRVSLGIVDVFVGAEFLGECRLVHAARNGHGAKTAAGRELDREMAQPTNALDRYQVPGIRTGFAQCVIGGDAGAHQRSSFRRVDLLRHGRHGGFGCNHVLSETAVETGGGRGARGAVGKFPFAAGFAVRTITAVPAHANALARLEELDAGADFLHAARHFMPRDAGELHARPLPFLENLVAMANAAGVHLDQHLIRSGFGDWAFDEFERAPSTRNLCDNHSTPCVGLAATEYNDG